MTEVGKETFIKSKIINEKIELTEHSLTLTQHLQSNEHLLTIRIKSDSDISKSHARLYLYDTNEENWIELANITPQYMITPANIPYKEYVDKFGESICSSKDSKYFKAILAVMGSDRAKLLRMAEQRLSEM